MRSAYTTLGIPGNASSAEIEQAFLKASGHYSRERLAQDPEAFSRLTDIRDAYKLLSDAEMRAAHDRKLSAAVSSARHRAPVIFQEEVAPWYTRPLIVLSLLAFSLFAAGGYMSYSRDQTRKILAAQELAQKKLEAEEAARAEAEEARFVAERARARAREENQERQSRLESSMFARNAMNADLQQQALATRQMEAERREKQRRESEVKNEERQRVNDAQRRLASDQQRIRELCYAQYNRPNC